MNTPTELAASSFPKNLFHAKPGDLVVYTAPHRDAKWNPYAPKGPRFITRVTSVTPHREAWLDEPMVCINVQYADPGDFRIRKDGTSQGSKHLAQTGTVVPVSFLDYVDAYRKAVKWEQDAPEREIEAKAQAARVHAINEERRRFRAEQRARYLANSSRPEGSR